MAGAEGMAKETGAENGVEETGAEATKNTVRNEGERERGLAGACPDGGWRTHLQPPAPVRRYRWRKKLAIR